MVINNLNDLLESYKLENDDKIEIRKTYREGIERCLKDCFRDDCDKVRIIYGGSVAKGTANSDSCDVDILCYLSSDCTLSLHDIYEKTYKALVDNHYCVSKKNCAMVVTSLQEEKWDKTVDVVPGKYIDNSDDDVYLWKNKTGNRLKTNPVKQISKVKESDSKEIIRLIKIFRNCHHFVLKSFYLEIFCINVAEPTFEAGDELLDKLIKFCKRWKDIGNVKLYDPANSNNDLDDIHEDYEFRTIRNKISQLLDALYTDDMDTIISCILNKSYNVENAYIKSANRTCGRNHAFYLPVVASPFRISINKLDEKLNRYMPVSSYETLSKGESLLFEICFNKSLIGTYGCTWVVTNAGYEARKAKCLRGKREDGGVRFEGYNKIFYKYESTLYYGDHFVFAVIQGANGKEYYTERIRIRIKN